MFTIRQEQFAAFSQAEVRKFEQSMLEHLAKFFPSECAKLGDASLTLLIRDGIKKADSYKIRGKQDVCKFIDLMIVFGRDFDNDPAIAEFGEIMRRDWQSASKMKAALELAHRYLGGR